MTVPADSSRTRARHKPLGPLLLVQCSTRAANAGLHAKANERRSRAEPNWFETLQ